MQSAFHVVGAGAALGVVVALGIGAAAAAAAAALGIGVALGVHSTGDWFFASLNFSDSAANPLILMTQ
jgi:hypothetical protein